MLLLVEVLLSFLAVLFSFLLAGKRSVWLDSAEDAFRRLAGHRRVALLVVAVAAVAGRLCVLPAEPVPVPRIDDEYSHLLLADTLVHARLANATHPMWVHFEALEVIMKPTYASAYQPMQAMFLAAGRAVTGSAFLGVVFSAALMCASICWMLQGFMPAGWALLGGLLSAMRFAVFSYWANSYMGGAAAAIGGALLLGALFRIIKGPLPRHAVVLGIAIAILANSRPYEGFILTATGCVVLFCWFLKLDVSGRRSAIRQVGVPVLLTLMVAGAISGFYLWRVTGSPFRMPYQIAWKTYGMVPKFLWQSPPSQDVSIRHEALVRFYRVFEMEPYLSTRDLPGLLREWGVRSLLDWTFYLGPLLSVPIVLSMVTVPYGFKLKDLSKPVQILALSLVSGGVAIAAETFSYPHYAAPVTGAIIGIVLVGMKNLEAKKLWGRSFGIWLTRAIPLTTVVILLFRMSVVPFHVPLTPSLMPSVYTSNNAKVPGNLVDEYLQKLPGRHLVFVHYVPGTETWMGWVHNAADIDAAKIVWAWDMGEKNDELVAYYAKQQRSIWYVNSTDSIPVLRWHGTAVP